LQLWEKMGRNGENWGIRTSPLSMSLSTKTFYTGTHNRNLDDKGRITIPSEWRAAHNELERFLAIPMEGGYVSVLPPGEVQKLHDKIAAVPMADTEAQEELNDFFSKAQDFTFDKQGRIALSALLTRHAGISKDAVLVGALTKFSIHSGERWALAAQKKAAAGSTGFLRRYQI